MRTTYVVLILNLQTFLVLHVTGITIWENELIKKIFQQDPAFCFQPFKASDCAGSHWISSPNNSRNAHESFLKPKTLFFLFTPKNPSNPEFLHLCGGKLPSNSNFDPLHQTEVFIHGYLDGVCRSAWMREMKTELFKRGLYNVILVDWTWGNGPDYLPSAENTKTVGKHAAYVIKNIMKQIGVGPEAFHLVGHSLGAHIAGFVGKSVKQLRRITALDPALSPFQNKSKLERLDVSDANLVDVIHTNGGSEVGDVIGDINPLGHADFYPNGGTNQHSCRHYILKSYLALDFLYATISLVPRICSHMHAVQYYKASINPNKCEMVGVLCPDYESFLSGECDCHQHFKNCAVMGMNYEQYIKMNNESLTDTIDGFRKFYLNTTIAYPYCDYSNDFRNVSTS